MTSNIFAPLSEQLIRHIQYWSGQTKARAFLPKFVYHFTELKNAISILTDGILLSREETLKQGKMKNENAACDIIANTTNKFKCYARLYYRPGTPTQYYNEGIRPIEKRYHGAHCAVPYFFAFDKIKILSTKGVLLSDGNVASPNAVVKPVDEMFSSIPFNEVFHSGYFDPESQSSIKYHRQAEILFPKGITLSNNLSWIGCRSNAERQTLLFCLGKDIANKYIPLIRLADSVFFKKLWIYVDNVDFNDNELAFYFNPNSEHSGKITVTLKVKFPGTVEASKKFTIDGHSRWSVTFPKKYPYITVKLFIFDCLAYANKLYSAELL